MNDYYGKFHPGLRIWHIYQLSPERQQRRQVGSEFVNALKTELESTFKEDISIYFDENQYDGLLETHDVDASLKDKLRFLVLFQLSPEHIAITIFN